MRGAYPGTFDPPTIAHLAIAEAAWRQGGVAQVDLVVSVSPLGKDPRVPSFEDRLHVLESVAATRPWLAVRTTTARLIADVVGGYDAVVLGTDKWLQVVDPAWYEGSTTRRDLAVAALPRVLLVPRPPELVPPGLPAGSVVLEIGEHHRAVSSSAVRSGRAEWMLPEAVEFDRRTGAWSDPDRYRRSRPPRRDTTTGDLTGPSQRRPPGVHCPGRAPD